MKIHIFGASGSGVTTLGENLSKKIAVSYFDSDEYFWEKSNPPFTIKRDPEQRNALIKENLNKFDDWILGGSVVDWGNSVFPIFDLVVFLWIPAEIRISRLKKREIERYGAVIFSDPNRKKKFDAFIEWAEDYDNCTGVANRNMKAHEDWLSKITCPVLEIRGDLAVEERANLVLEKIDR